MAVERIEKGVKKVSVVQPIPMEPGVVVGVGDALSMAPTQEARDQYIEFMKQQAMLRRQSQDSARNLPLGSFVPETNWSSNLLEKNAEALERMRNTDSSLKA